MIDIHAVIKTVKTALVDTFSEVDTWFDKGCELRVYRPVDGRWTIDEILEHIGLTNHFLLILIDKGASKALQNPHKLDLQDELTNQNFNVEKLNEIGMHGAFLWIRPEHMEPTGVKPTEAVRQQLQEQLNLCLSNLERLPNGEGVLYKTTMTVNSLGKINVYEYIYFLAQHARRHISQMQKIEMEFLTNNSHKLSKT